MKKTKGFLAEFKEFIMRGNVIDLAVGVIIGGAFGAIVTGLVENIIQPLINSILGGDIAGTYVLPWAAEKAAAQGEEALAAVTINYGAFISAIINFIIIAFVIFLFVKAINKLRNRNKEEEAPTTKTCPYCKSEVDIEATKCPHCTSDIPEDAE